MFTLPSHFRECQNGALRVADEGDMRFYFSDEGETFACAIRPFLEAETEEFVSCAVCHPLDEHVELEAPSESVVRRAILSARGDLSRLRATYGSSRASSFTKI